MKEANYTTGLEGEEQALRYLTDKGLTLIERRYRGSDGEIDLVMADGDTLVFVEVKYRPTGHTGDGLLAVSRGKRRRMVHAAQVFRVKRKAMDRPVRFDVVEITQDGICHIPNAFWADRP